MPTRLVLTQGEVGRLLAQVTNTVYGLRDRALFLSLYRLGLRRGKLLDLDLDDVPALDVGDALCDYLGRARPSLRTDHPDSERALFLSASGRRFHAQQLKELLHRLRRAARVRRPVTPRELRRAHAAHALADGVPLGVLQRRLGYRAPGQVLTQLHLPTPQEAS